MISFISLSKLLMLWYQVQTIAVSAADAAPVNPGDIKTLLANGLSTYPIKGNPVFSNSSFW